MRSLVPYPLLAVSLAVMWMLLSGFTAGQLVLAAAIGIGATHGLAALGEISPAIRRWLAIPELIAIVLYDILRSNLAVATLILGGRRQQARKSGFVAIELRLRNPTALAILAVILTSTPGTAWLDYHASRGELLLHVFDLVDDAHWRELIANRYERLLMEIFE